MKAIVEAFWAVLGVTFAGLVLFGLLGLTKACIDEERGVAGTRRYKGLKTEWERECVKHRESYDRHEDCAIDAAKLFPGVK